MTCAEAGCTFVLITVCLACWRVLRRKPQALHPVKRPIPYTQRKPWED